MWTVTVIHGNKQVGRIKIKSLKAALELVQQLIGVMASGDLGSRRDGHISIDADTRTVTLEVTELRS